MPFVGFMRLKSRPISVHFRHEKQKGDKKDEFSYSVFQQVWDTHWGKNGKFSLKIEKSEVKIAPIFGFNPLIDTLAYPKIPFFRSNLVWFGLGALLKMWKISEILTLSIKLL